MSVSINQAFVKQFERDVHEAYQRQGSKLRSMVRSINDVNGSSAVFQKVGKGTAAIKSTHGMVPVMNIAHTTIECPVTDYYAGDWVDKFDELKVMHDERAVIASTDPYVRRMRPTFGYMMAVTWGAQMMAVAYVIVANPARAGEVLNAMEGLSTIWAVALSVMGIYMYQRSAEKKAGLNIPALPISSIKPPAAARAPAYND